MKEQKIALDGIPFSLSLSLPALLNGNTLWPTTLHYSVYHDGVVIASGLHNADIGLGVLDMAKKNPSSTQALIDAVNEGKDFQIEKIRLTGSYGEKKMLVILREENEVYNLIIYLGNKFNHITLFIGGRENCTDRCDNISTPGFRQSPSFLVNRHLGHSGASITTGIDDGYSFGVYFCASGKRFSGITSCDGYHHRTKFY